MLFFFFLFPHLPSSSPVGCLNCGCGGSYLCWSKTSRAESPALCQQQGLGEAVLACPQLCSVLSQQQREAGPSWWEASLPQLRHEEALWVIEQGKQEAMRL